MTLSRRPHRRPARSAGDLQGGDQPRRSARLASRPPRGEETYPGPLLGPANLGDGISAILAACTGLHRAACKDGQAAQDARAGRWVRRYSALQPSKEGGRLCADLDWGGSVSRNVTSPTCCRCTGSSIRTNGRHCWHWRGSPTTRAGGNATATSCQAGFRPMSTATRTARSPP